MSNTESEHPFTRLKEWYRSLKEPEHVQKAPKHIRRKREVWQVASTILSFVAVGIPVAVLDLAATWFPPTGLLAIATAVVMIGAALLLDIYVVFPWGFDRFGLVSPWQFRDAEVEDESN